MAWGEIPNYDVWKTACCERWPDCKNCPDNDDELDEFEEYDDVYYLEEEDLSE